MEKQPIQICGETPFVMPELWLAAFMLVQKMQESTWH